jgi:hypothetical protein
MKRVKAGFFGKNGIFMMLFGLYADILQKKWP